MPLDDVSYLDGDPKKVKFVTFRLAGNRAKDKAGQYIVAQNLVEVDIRVIALILAKTHSGRTSAKPVADRFGARRSGLSMCPRVSRIWRIYLTVRMLRRLSAR